MLTPLECFWRKNSNFLEISQKSCFAIDLYISNRRSSPSMNLRPEALLPEHHPEKHRIVVNPKFPSTQKNGWGKKNRQNIRESFPKSWCTKIENCLKPPSSESSDEVFQHLCTNSGCFCLRFCLRNATDEELCRVEGCFVFSVQA